MGTKSFALYVPTGPGKARQYNRNGYRQFLSLEALLWRSLVRDAWWGQDRLEGPIEIVLYHLSDRTGDDDCDHQLVPLLDALTKCGAWDDDKDVERVTLARDYVAEDDLAAGVYVWAWTRGPDESSD